MGQNVVLFHSALGLRPAIRQWAERLREAGHQVAAPDLFDGEVFDDLADGIRKRDALGIPELMKRAAAAVAGLPPDVVFMGLSMGAAAAELLAGTRPGARAAVLLHGAVPPAAMRIASWPADVAVQLHFAADDPWVPVPAVRGLVDGVRAAGARVETFTYGGKLPHLFDDPGVAGNDPAATKLLHDRVLAFLSSLG